MTDLRIYIDNSIQSSVRNFATQACTEAPPTQARSNDACRMGVALTADSPRVPAPRVILFDRQGDHFVLSPQNNAENLTWVGSNQNLQGILTTLRVAGTLNRSVGRGSNNSNMMDYFLWLSRYIVTGTSQHDRRDNAAVPTIDLDEILVDAFSGAGSQGMVPLIGGLTLLRRETWLPEAARERVRTIAGVLDLVPTYQAISNHFFNPQRMQNLGRLSEAQYTNIARVYQFVRRVVIALRDHRPLSFDATALQAFRAYGEFYRAELASGAQPEFCAALEAGLREANPSNPATNFVSECRQALAWAAVPAEQAMRESARQNLTDAAGMQRLQQGIANESQLANMRVEWLSHRGAYGQVLDALLNRISLVPGANGATARVHFDVANFSADLRRLTMLTSRGEYDLSALAFLRRIFGTEGDAPALRAFADGVVGDLNWDLNARELSEIRSLQTSLRGRRRSSVDFSQVGMPVLMGATCAVGVGGIVLSQTLPALRSSPGAQLGVGLTGSALAGGGCLGLAGHYLWPAVAPRAVHNRYAWDLGTSAVGSAVGIGTYLLIHFLNQGRPIEPGQRNPVDPFGP